MTIKTGLANRCFRAEMETIVIRVIGHQSCKYFLGVMLKAKISNIASARIFCMTVLFFNCNVVANLVRFFALYVKITFSAFLYRSHKPKKLCTCASYGHEQQRQKRLQKIYEASHCLHFIQ
jgi:hypothetical protein